MILFRQPGRIALEERDFVFSKRPLLKKVFEENRTKTLRRFAADNVRRMVAPHDGSRRDQLLAAVGSIVEKRLGWDVAKALTDELARHYGASTADHHTSLNLGLPICSNLLLGYGMEAAFPGEKYGLVLSCASVSQNNEDFPRGLLFHEKENGEFVQKRAALLPSKNRNSSVYGFRSFTREEVLGAQKEISAHRRDILEILEYYRAPNVLGSASLCEQITKVNFRLWQKLLPFAPATPVYLEFEELASRLLLDCHLGFDTAVSRMMFGSGEAAQALGRLTADFESSVRQGSVETDFFWGLSAGKNYRLRLARQGGQLVAQEPGADFSISWNPEAVSRALREKTIMPNMFLVFVVLHLYYGLNCFGGFNQIHYLDAMARTYRASGIDPQAPRPQSVLFHYGLAFLFLEDGGTTLPVNGPDVVSFGQEHLLQQLEQFLDTATFESVFDQSCAIYYRVLAVARQQES